MRNNSWKIILAGATAILALLISGACEQETEERLQVGIVYTAPHALINQIVDGFRDGLQAEFGEGVIEVVERHASGDESQYSATVEGLLSRRPDLLVPITTPIAQAALASKPVDLPMVFLAITDPQGAGLVESIERPEKSTGVSDLAPFEEIIPLIRRLYPAARRIGFPYSPDEQPAVFSRDQVLRIAPRHGFEVDARPVTSDDELTSLLEALAASSDALLIGADNKMFEASPLIARVALDASKPFFSGDSTSIKAGALGGYTIDYVMVGREGARVAAEVLRGADVRTIPVHVMNEGVLELNLATAKALGIALPRELVAKAHQVYND